MKGDGLRKGPSRECLRTFACALLALCLGLSSAPARAEPGDSCVACHGDSRFLVTNKKLYDYFQQWKQSIHRQEDVSCVDCHGGDSDLPDKEGAHGADLSQSAASSAVNFRNIPETCGQCHDEIYDAFRKSHHFEHVVAKEQEEQGPTCVTCHGSINVDVLSVETVFESCARCHNEETDNHPENPEKARDILNKFLSIHRFYRYITARDASGSEKFFSVLEEHIDRLAVTWHTFDLEEIEKQTTLVLELLKAKRDEVRARSAKR